MLECITEDGYFAGFWRIISNNYFFSAHNVSNAELLALHVFPLVLTLCNVGLTGFY